MKKFFASHFSKPYDPSAETIGYFYPAPWFEEEHSLTVRARDNNVTEEKFLAEWSKCVARDFSESWSKRTLSGEFDETKDHPCAYFLKGSTRDPFLGGILDRIIRESIPFMDIASSGAMGWAPYLLHENPDIPCLITDIDPLTVRALRRCLDEQLPGNRVEVASFDNLEMPLKDASLEYITGIGAITFSGTDRTFRGDSDEFFARCEETLLREVFRVLKPGGRFLTFEAWGDVLYDREEVLRFFETHKTFLGLYTKYHVLYVLDQVEEHRRTHPSFDERIQRLMKNVGFEIEAVRTYRQQHSERIVAQFFSPTGDFEPVGEHGPEDSEVIRSMYHPTIYVLRKPEEE